ncbi:MAG TPA: alkaline phosphatase family protein [Gemmatimonadaceae bacterium]|nr:alkaline phosphatase family protein [Gemmatimonadaceae bacterium]
MPLILLVADGARFDTIDGGTRAGASASLPSLARLRAEGALYPVTTAFPSVTGVAYAPFLTGRFPGPSGLPGLRWYDRAHTRCRRFPYARSYLGAEMRHLDEDLDPSHPTLFELAPSRWNAMSMLGRGTARGERLGRDVRTLARAAYTHWSGDVGGWIKLDEYVARVSTEHIVEHRPAFACIALLGLDKASHSEGHESPLARRALAGIDAAVGQLRAAVERAGMWDDTHLWIVSDHGHSLVHAHDDLAALVRESGHRVLAHPWLFTRGAEVAVMVSGNAMAHLYVELERRERAGWIALRERWEPLVRTLLALDSVDMVMLPLDDTRTEVRTRDRGSATIVAVNGRYSYSTIDGDPLGLGLELANVTATDAYEALVGSAYPDAIVQIAQLSSSARSGDIIVSAAPGWDFREKWEPVKHVSAHGSLHRDQMLVPLLTNRTVRGIPRRTTDVMPSALHLLGLPGARDLDGESFL